MPKSIKRKTTSIILIFTLIYSVFGLAFALTWKSELGFCRDVRKAQGEFVEPEFQGVLGIAIDTALWPLYSTVNIKYENTLFPTPCATKN